MRLSVFAHADVADRRGDQNALRAAQRAQHDFDGELAAVLAPGGELDAGADLLRECIFVGAQSVGDEPLGETLRHDAADQLPEQFVAAIAELLLRLQIHENDHAANVHHHHGIGRSLQQAAVFCAGFLGFTQVARNLRKAPQPPRRVP